MKRICMAVLLGSMAFGAQAQTKDVPGEPPGVNAPAAGAIILAPGLDQGAREKPAEMKPRVREGIREPNASSGASSPEPAVDAQSENRRGSADPRDPRNLRDDTGKRDNQER